MRRTNPGQTRWIGVVVAGAALIFTGAGKKKETPPKIEETIGDVASIVGTDFKVEGVGLVIGLDNTGSDPSPSWQRTKLLDEMRKSGVPHPEQILRTKTVTLVTVRAIVPAGMTIADKFDVEVELAASTATTSLAGGWLVSTQLAQRAKTREGEKDDKVIASAVGPVMVGNTLKPNDPKVGRVLGGGHVKEDSPYALTIKEARRSGRTSQLLQDVVNNRFHEISTSDQKGMANAKTDSFLVLKVPKTYHHNQDRYHQLIKYLALIDNASLRERRTEQWGRELLDPKKAGLAALRLEGLGPGAAPTLRAALGSPDETVRFFAAESLAYMNDSEGDNAKILAEVAKNRPEFRSFALKAMAATDQSASLLKLRALMAEPEFELRYGAFDALRTLDPTDPFLGRVRVLDPIPDSDSDSDAMAMQITSTVPKKRAVTRDEPFSLYVVDCEGPPMIHVSRNTRAEMVIFGKTQKLLTPVVLGSGGPLLVNAADGDDEVQISKITEKTLDAPRVRLTSELYIADLVRQLANIGASYPEVATLLGAASVQKNLPGPFVVDAVPVDNKAYGEAQLADLKAKRDDALKKTSGDSERTSFLERLGKRFRR